MYNLFLFSIGGVAAILIVLVAIQKTNSLSQSLEWEGVKVKNRRIKNAVERGT